MNLGYKMSRSLKILHIEDVESDAELVDRVLVKSGMAFEKLLVETRNEFTEALTGFNPDIILSDHSLPAFNSLEALKILKGSGIDIPFILITATVSEEFAVNVMKEGASDYMLKDRLQRLPNAIVNVIEKYQSEQERKNYLNQVIASEALFKKAELLAEFGTWTVELATNITSWSAGTYRLLGYEPGEVEPSYRHFIKNVHPDDINEIEKNLKKALKNRQPGQGHCRIINKNGSIRYLYTHFELELDGNGNPVNIIGFNQDVTLSKLADIERENYIEELQTADDRQSDILNALPASVVLLNEAGKIVAVNQAWKAFTLANNLGVPRYGVGYTYIAISEKATGVDTLSAREVAAGINDILSGASGQFSMEYSYHSPQGKAWFQLLAAPLTDKAKKGAVVLHIDVTARKLTEELLAQSRANLQTIFENTDVGYVLCDMEYKIVSFNAKFTELCSKEFNKKPRVGHHVFSYFPEEKILRQQETIPQLSHNRKVCYETSYTLNDGSIQWYEITWAAVADETKENRGYIIAFKDITERKTSDIEKDRLTADLVYRNNDLEQFAYIVSHNLRAPVANIIGLSDMLNSFDLDIKESRQIKTALAASIGLLDNVIIDLHNILQIRGRGHESREPVLFEQLVKEILLSLGNLAENVKIEYNFNNVDCMAAVKSYLYSIFYNLILNAIKYRRPDANPVIRISTKKSADQIEILFEDNGKGISEANLKSLFGLYKRFDTSVEGKGIGLFMTKMQVEVMGGAISVRSRENEGTTFTVQFRDG